MTHFFFKSKLGIVITAVVTTLLWGSAFPFIKLSYGKLGIGPTDTSQQIFFAGERFFLASCFIFLILLVSKKSLSISRSQAPDLIKLGLIQTFITYILFYIGLSSTTGIQSAIINGSLCIFQIIFAIFMFKEKLTLNKTLGMLLGLVGIYVVNMNGSFSVMNFGLGEILLLGSVITGAYGNLRAKVLTSRMEVGVITAYQMLFGSLGLLLVGTIGGGTKGVHWNFSMLAIFIYLAGLSAVSFLLWNNLMKVNPVGKISLFMFLIPVFGVILSTIILGEVFTLTHFAGLLFVVCGIFIVFVKEARVGKKDAAKVA